MGTTSRLAQTPNWAKHRPPTKPRKDPLVRDYLTPEEVKAMVAAAKKAGGRTADRDALLVLLAYRHGLRASELTALRWDQIELKAGLLHVARLKHGDPSTHPLRGPELRALRAWKRSQGEELTLCLHVPAPWTNDAAHGPLRGCTGREGRGHRASGSSAHAAPRDRLLSGQRRPRYAGDPALPRAQEYPAYGEIHPALGWPVQRLLEGLNLRGCSHRSLSTNITS